MLVLGVDNLIFIAILADKLPPKQRDKARVLGLGLALCMRLALLSVVSWLVTLTTPLFSLGSFAFSGRDLILLGGGLFLLFKSTSELHERLEGVPHSAAATAAYASFSVVVAQIVVLDAVFSLDAVVTAVGMVDQLPVMMADIRAQLLDTPHGIFPVCRGSLDAVVGTARAKDLLAAIVRDGKVDVKQLRPPLYVAESTTAIRVIDILRTARGQLVLVNDEHGALGGLVTPIDVLEAIAGEFPDEDETLEVQATGRNQWTVAGTADLRLLEQTLQTHDLVSDDDSYISIAGLLLAKLGHQPRNGDAWLHEDLEFRIADADAQRIKSVAVRRITREQATLEGRA
ncbi:transporter associated domain-containing protein [Variovorax robiniae]|uniref:Transporter associated domain-containing protein n=1 Tax=Variovorax robiniae TaxID=1836199 RepID=A0ABU8XAP1_9BURK